VRCSIGPGEDTLLLREHHAVDHLVFLLAVVSGHGPQAAHERSETMDVEKNDQSAANPVV
jgi:hypothetical protein